MPVDQLQAEYEVAVCLKIVSSNPNHYMNKVLFQKSILISISAVHILQPCSH